jgi:hypothetical protein
MKGFLYLKIFPQTHEVLQNTRGRFTNIENIHVREVDAERCEVDGPAVERVDDGL